MSGCGPQRGDTGGKRLFSYIGAHWRGELSLRTSLWVNMLAGSIVLSLAELRWLSCLTKNPTTLVQFTLLSLLLSRLIVYPWQLTGLLRSIERDYLEHKNILKTRALQTIALSSLMFTLVYALEVVQGAVFYRHQLEVYTQDVARVAYQLEVTSDGKRLNIEGGLDIGITEAVRSLLVSQAQIRSVVLNSGGGQIYEGRGLARVFSENGLDTYVFEECSSACATAYIGGRQRYLGPEGKLGFHQYRLDKTGFDRIVPFYDLRAEQARDLALFEDRGIKQSFLTKMFARGASDLWIPDQMVLLDAGIVHQIVTYQP